MGSLATDICNHMGNGFLGLASDFVDLSAYIR